MKKNYENPTVEFIDFEGSELFTEGCSSDCTACFYAECEPSDCLIASPATPAAEEPVPDTTV